MFLIYKIVKVSHFRNTCNKNIWRKIVENTWGSSLMVEALSVLRIHKI